MVYAGEENEEEGGSGERGDLIPRVVAGTNLRRWKHDDDPLSSLLSFSLL